jgi:hypothetical protein
VVPAEQTVTLTPFHSLLISQEQIQEISCNGSIYKRKNFFIYIRKKKINTTFYKRYFIKYNKHIKKICVHLKRTRYFALYRINVCNKVLPVQHNYMPNPGKTKQIPQYDLARTKLCIYQSESFKSDARSILRKFVQSHEFLHIYKIKPVPVPEYREYTSTAHSPLRDITGST